MSKSLLDDELKLFLLYELSEICRFGQCAAFYWQY